MLLPLVQIKALGNSIKLTLQIAILSNNSQSSGSSQSEESTLATIECATIDSGINLINNYISKKVNLSHCKAVVISEVLASEGLSEHIYTLVNNIELRPDCNVIISRCDASTFLENSKPTLESVSARYYELVLNSSEYTGYIENITIRDLYTDLLSLTSDPHTILGGINSDDSHKNNSDLPLYDTEGSYKADDTPIKAPTKVENMGLAVFRGDKLVGELDGTETLCHLLVTNKLDSAVITIPSPIKEQDVISLYLTQTKNTKNTLEFVNNTPFIESTVFVTCNVLSMDENFDFSDEDTVTAIEEYCSLYLEDKISSCLYKTAKEYKADIFDFGSYALKNYSTWKEWQDSDWLNNYENSFFSVTVKSIVQSGQLFTKI